jgi:hypothetical protein
MAYLGNAPARSFISFERQVFTIVNSQTAYTLDHSVTNENDIRLVINNIVQEPGSGKAYTASGTTLTLSAALTNGTDEMYCVFLGRATATNAPAAGSVNTAAIADLNVTTAKIAADAITEAKIADDAVESEHLNDNVISGQTELASAPASTDELLISDAGVLKRVDVSLVGGNNTPSFKAYGTTQAIPNNTATVIAYNTELWDTDSDYDNSTYRFTPQVSGKYFVYSIIRVESGSSYNHLELRIRKNGGDMAHAFNSPKYYDTVNVSALVDMNGSSDYIDFAIFQGSGGSLNTNSGRQFNQGGAFKLIGV